MRRLSGRERLSNPKTLSIRERGWVSALVTNLADPFVTVQTLTQVHWNSHALSKMEEVFWDCLPVMRVVSPGKRVYIGYVERQ